MVNYVKQNKRMRILADSKELNVSTMKSAFIFLLQQSTQALVSKTPICEGTLNESRSTHTKMYTPLLNDTKTFWQYPSDKTLIHNRIDINQELLQTRRYTALPFTSNCTDKLPSSLAAEHTVPPFTSS